MSPTVARILDQIEKDEVSELFLELPSRDEYPDYYEVIENPISLTEMKKMNLSLIRLRKAFKLMISNAMSFNRKGSAVYKDAEDLLSIFEEIYEREFLAEHCKVFFDKCKNPLFDDLKVESFTQICKEIEKILESLEGQEREIIEENYKSFVSSFNGESQDLVHDGVSYKIGDFCRIGEKIVQISEIFHSPDQVQMEFSAFWFARPTETVHKSGMKFMKNEVFKTVEVDDYLASDISGKCYVLYIKDFLRGTLNGVEESDIYCCESRYTKKAFQKIKNWSLCMPEGYVEPEITEFDEPRMITKESLDGEEDGSPKRKRIEESDLPTSKRRLTDHKIPVPIPLTSGQTPINRNAKQEEKVQFFVPNLDKKQKPFEIRDKKGVVKWFPTPPLLVENTTLNNSKVYEEYLKKKISKKSIAKLPNFVVENIENEMEVDEETIDGSDEQLIDVLHSIFH